MALTIVASLLSSLYVLETYRVMFLQRPPGFCPKFAALNYGSTSTESAHQNTTCSSVTDFTTLLRSLLSPHLDCGKIMKPLDSSFCLTYLIVLSWHTKSKKTWLISSEALWKPALIELALHKWRNKMDSSGIEITPWQNLLFHSAFVNIHADLSLIIRLVGTFARGLKLAEPACTALRAWRESKSCQVALWHAVELIDIAKAQTIFTHQSVLDGTAIHTTKVKLTEAPHVCAGVYMATLTLWSGNMTQSTPDKKGARSILESSIHILSCLNVRMASILQNVLRHLVVAMINESEHKV